MSEQPGNPQGAGPIGRSSDVNYLLAQHQTLLDASSISAEVAAARGYRSEQTKAHLGRLGFSRSQWSTPCLVIPVWGVNGQIVLHQIRPDNPRTLNGKPLKYETPAKAHTAIDVPPKVLPNIGNPNIPLYITEGVRKADAAASRGLCCIAILGVWNWRGTNRDAGKTALPDWESIALDRRYVHVIFDSDAANKEDIQSSLIRLKPFLENRGARVKIVALPAGANGEKVGLDDFFAAGKTVDDLRQLPALDLSLAGGSQGGGVISEAARYRATSEGLFMERNEGEKQSSVQLTNFQVRIVAEITVTDGVDEHREFEIEAIFSETRTITVPAEQFEQMSWVIPSLGAEAIIFAGYRIKDHVRAAIQTLSKDILKITAYGHLGWTKKDGHWIYLHAGGAIGADAGADEAIEADAEAGDPIEADSEAEDAIGADSEAEDAIGADSEAEDAIGADSEAEDAIGADVGADSSEDGEERPTPKPNEEKELETVGPMGPILSEKSNNQEIRVHLPQALAKFRLPEPPEGPELVTAVRASLRMLEVAPEKVVFPLFAAIWRAPITTADFSLQIIGPTGAGKSELAALAQQHYGVGLDARNLPGSWSSTANALEAIAFLAKDALLVTDDFVPQGSRSDVDRAHREADRLLRLGFYTFPGLILTMDGVRPDNQNYPFRTLFT